MALSRYISAKVICRTADIKPSFWANTWELDAGAESLILTPDLVANALANFHKEVLNSKFLVDRVVLSTWAPDGKPYNPTSFFVKQFQMSGVASGSPLPLSNTVLVKRTGAMGKQGSLLLRGWLTEEMIEDGALVPTIFTSTQDLLTDHFGTLVTALDPCAPSMLRQQGPLNLMESRVYTGLYIKAASVKRMATKRKRRNISEDGANFFSDVAKALPGAVDAINGVITIFNALPISDVPLLPAP
jgi:hypothetical protein